MQKTRVRHISENNFIIPDILDLENYPENLWEIILQESNILSGNRGGRKMARMTDPGMKYTLGGKSYPRKLYTPTIKQIQNEIELKLKFAHDYFNTCTLNYYPSGRSGFRAHTDYMRDLADPMIVTMLTLGNSNRVMELINRRTKQKFEIELPHNSLVIMGPYMQQTWLHGIPKSEATAPARLSLSYRRQGATIPYQREEEQKSKSLF